MKYRLGDICTITKGATGIMKAIPGPYTMIALGETDKTHIEYQFDTKAVIIPLVSSTGHGHASMKRVKYCEGKFALGNILCAVIPNDESFVLAKYLHIYLHWNREELLVSQMKGMANVSLPMNRIADVMVTVPSIDKQREIIELEKQLVEKELKADSLFADQLTQLDNLNQAILQEAVQGKLVKQDTKDEPASELLKCIKAEKEALIKAKKLKSGKSTDQSVSYIDEYQIPKSWIWCKTDDIFFVTKLAGFEYTEHIKLKETGEIPVIRAQNVRPLEIDKTNLLYIDREVSQLLDRCSLTKKCLLVTFIGAGIGDVATFKENERWHLAPNVAKMEPFEGCEELIDVTYVNYFLMSKIGQRELFKHIKATAQPSLSMGTIRDIDIPLPPLSEQKRIVAEIEKQFALTKQLKEHIIANQQATEQLLKALLHQAFEVEEMVIAKPKGKVIELKPTNVDYYRRTVLAAEIVWQLHREPTLGHLKLQKLIYLCQKSADMQLPTNFLRQAMGPYDNRLMRSIDKQLKEKKWFEYKKEQVFKYQPLEKAGQHHNDFIKYFSAESESIQFIIDKFKTIKSDIVEIVATLYACMDNMLNENVIFSEALLIQRFYEWSEEKKKFSEKEVERVFSRMKETGIVPNGYNF